MPYIVSYFSTLYTALHCDKVHNELQSPLYVRVSETLFHPTYTQKDIFLVTCILYSMCFQTKVKKAVFKIIKKITKLLNLVGFVNVIVFGSFIKVEEGYR